MGVYRNLGSAKNKKVWDAVDAAERIISQWPAWKRGVDDDEVSDVIAAVAVQTDEQRSENLSARGKKRSRS